MTKARVLEYFGVLLSDIKRKEKGVPDYYARTRAWLRFLRDLFLDGEITREQVRQWTLPQPCYPRDKARSEHLAEYAKAYREEQGSA